MYELLGISLALAALLTFNAALSLVTSAVWRLIHSKAKRWPARTQAQTIFALRVIPGCIAIVCVVALFVPAFLAHEPRQSENVSWKLAVLAFISIAGLLLALWRGLAAWMTTRHLVANWLRNSEAIHVPQVPIPVFRLQHPFPVIAIVGVLRPRLFIADHLMASLTPEELSAAIAHECGHLFAHDNLKRVLLRLCRDMLTIVPCGRTLDQEWIAASEVAADDFAARNSNEQALDLASALVKIARLIPTGQRPGLSVIVSLIGEDSGSIRHRVNRLASLTNCSDRTLAAIETRLISTSLWLPFGAFLTAALVIATDADLLYPVHLFMEAIVSALQ
ncbi:MAG: M56 family metallopeptidase [Acidobacteria bacterium]|nr:M56 family metallopeptidase [Acidobacteriota bacterium]